MKMLRPIYKLLWSSVVAKTRLGSGEGGSPHNKDCPGKEFIPAPPESGCNCSQCPHMRLNTLEKLYLCLKHEQPEITMDEAVRLRALQPIERMMAMRVGVK